MLILIMVVLNIIIAIILIFYPKGAPLNSAVTFWAYIVDIFTLTIVVIISLLLLNDELINMFG